MRHSHGMCKADVHWQESLFDDKRCIAQKPAPRELKSPGEVVIGACVVVTGACVVVGAKVDGIAVVTAYNIVTQHWKPQHISHQQLSLCAWPATWLPQGLHTSINEQ